MKTTPFRFGVGVTGLAIIIDQASKFWILTIFEKSPLAITVTPFFNIVQTWNRGISFGLFNDGGEFNALILSLIAVAIVAYLLRWLWGTETLWIALALGLIIGGALGNVIDRAVHRAVLDFLDVHVAGFHWPAFNAADSFITVGAILLIFDYLFARGDDRNTMDDAKK
ncbi:MAG: signal peptidase II [Pseudomonadota bacterium]|nr:signal peptidase II [Pseudomonadota bacterium]